MREVKRKIFSVILTLAMVFTLMPNTKVFAKMSDGIDYTLVLTDDGAYMDKQQEGNELDLSTFNGAISFNASTHEWTMKDFTFETTAAIAVEISDGGTLTVTGTNTITSNQTSESYPSKGIWAAKDLTIKGDGALNVTASKVLEGSYNSSYGIYSEGKLTIDGIELTAKGNEVKAASSASSYGIFSSGLVVNSGIVDAIGMDAESVTGSAGSYGIYKYNGAFELNGGKVTGTAGSVKTEDVQGSGGFVTSVGISVGSNTIWENDGYKEYDGFIVKGGSVTGISTGTLTTPYSDPTYNKKSGILLNLKKYYINDKATVYSGASKDNAAKITIDETWMKTKDGSTAYASITCPHDWTYAVEAAKIIATCDKNCGEKVAHTASLTLTASNVDYSGSAYAGASLGDTAAWTAEGLAVPKIMYVGRGSTTYAESETAPTAAGTYTAKITVGDKTASADFEIKAPKEKTEEAKTDNTTGYKTPSKKTSVKVPDKVVKDGVTYKVTSLKKNAFHGKYVKKVELPSSITKIDAKAFVGDNKLVSLKITSKKLTVSSKAFSGMKKSAKAKVKIIVSKNMSKKDFATLKKALVKQGLKAKNIVRK